MSQEFSDYEEFKKAFEELLRNGTKPQIRFIPGFYQAPDQIPADQLQQEANLFVREAKAQMEPNPRAVPVFPTQAGGYVYSVEAKLEDDEDDDLPTDRPIPNTQDGSFIWARFRVFEDQFNVVDVGRLTPRTEPVYSQWYGGLPYIPRRGKESWYFTHSAAISAISPFGTFVNAGFPSVELATIVPSPASSFYFAYDIIDATGRLRTRPTQGPLFRYFNLISPAYYFEGRLIRPIPALDAYFTGGSTSPWILRHPNGSRWVGLIGGTSFPEPLRNTNIGPVGLHGVEAITYFPFEIQIIRTANQGAPPKDGWTDRTYEFLYDSQGNPKPNVITAENYGLLGIGGDDWKGWSRVSL